MQNIYVNMHGFINSSFGFIVPKNITIELYGYPGMVTYCGVDREWPDVLDKSNIITIGPGQYIFDINTDIDRTYDSSITYIVDNLSKIKGSTSHTTNIYKNGRKIDFINKNYTISRLCFDLIQNDKYKDKDITIKIICCLGVEELKNMCDYLYKYTFKITKDDAGIHLKLTYPKDETNTLLGVYFEKFPIMTTDMIFELKEGNGIINNFQFTRGVNVHKIIYDNLKSNKIDEVFKSRQDYEFYIYGYNLKSKEVKLLYYLKYEDDVNYENEYDLYLVGIFKIEGDDLEQVQINFKSFMMISNSKGGIIDTDIKQNVFSVRSDYEGKYNANETVIVITYELVCIILDYIRNSSLEKLLEDLNKLVKGINVPIIDLNSDEIKIFLWNFKRKYVDDLYLKIKNPVKIKNSPRDSYLNEEVEHIRILQ